MQRCSKHTKIPVEAILIVLAVLVVVGLFAAVIASAVYNYLDEGWLTDKKHYDGYTSYGYNRITTNNGVITVPHEVHHRERWEFTVTYEDKRDIWDVSEDQYNSADVGEWVKRR